MQMWGNVSVPRSDMSNRVSHSPPGVLSSSNMNSNIAMMYALSYLLLSVLGSPVQVTAQVLEMLAHTSNLALMAVMCTYK